MFKAEALEIVWRAGSVVDCFARNDTLVIAEERSDEAIQRIAGTSFDCFALLAMTGLSHRDAHYATAACSRSAPMACGA